MIPAPWQMMAKAAPAIDHRAGNLSEYGDSEQEQQKRRGRGSQTAAPTASPKGIARPAYIAG